MPQFLTIGRMERRFVELPQAVELARPGYLVQFRGNGKLFTPIVRLACGGGHTHSAMMTGYNEVSEVREFVGGRISTLDFQLKRFHHRLDLFRVRDEFYDPVGVGRSIQAMRSMAAVCGYDWLNILNIALRKMPGFHLMFDDGCYDDDPTTFSRYRHCSDAVCAAYQFGLGVDPVPNWPNALVTPHDLTRSMLFEYVFSM